MKKLSYFFAVLLVSSLITLFYFLFLTNEKPASLDHASLSLQPYTTHEQQDLIITQEQEEGAIENGPLNAQMAATDAEAKVLNLRAARENTAAQ